MKSARSRLLDAAVKIVREQGYGGTSVDTLCAEAGVTKGAFFHHFKSKEALGVAVADYWTENANALFGAGAWHLDPDPVARILGYIDFRAGLIEGAAADFSCVAGTMVQELHETSPAIRDACGRSIFGHAATLEADFAAAMAAHSVSGTTAASLARHCQAVLQGGFILAKAANDPSQAREAIAHLRRYISLLFNQGEDD